MQCPIGQEDHGTSDLVSMPHSLSPRPKKTCSSAKCPWRRKMALTPAPWPCSEALIELMLKHIHQLPAGNPCPCSRNTMPSLQQTNLPSSWRILHRNHMVQKTSRTHRPGWGNPPC